MAPRPRLLVPLYGCCSGWLIALLVARAKLISFHLPTSPHHPLTYCEWIHYPKIADYFWVAITVLAGFAGIIAAVGLWHVVMTRARPKRLSSGLLVVAISCLVSVFLIASHLGNGTSVALSVFAGISMVLPWLDQRWYLPASPPSVESRWSPLHGRRWLLPASLLVGMVWIHDPCWRERGLDPMHEGVHLLYVQHALNGEPPGVTIRTEYGPLYSHSIIWWLNRSALTVESQRRYFLGVQAVGTALYLATVGWAVAGVPAALITALAMLGLTPAAATTWYGWCNTLRSGLALAGLILCWRGLESGSARRLGTAGVLLTMALLYSPEFGFAAWIGAALLLLFPRDGQTRERAVAVVLGTATLVFAVLWLAMFRSQALVAMHHSWNEYAVARISGHAAKPMPAFAWWSSVVSVFQHSEHYLWHLSLWGPLLLCGVAGAWLICQDLRGADGTPRLILALIVATLIFQIPAIARPTGQQSASAPPAILLGGLLLDGLARRSRPGFAVTATLVVSYAVFASYGNLQIGYHRITARPTPMMTAYPAIPRLGRLQIPADQMKSVTAIIAAVQSRCPRGQRFFLAAPFDLALPFLDDRCTIAPWVDPVLATTPQASAEMLAALDRARPSLVVVGDWLDIPLPIEHPELWAYIESHYRLDKKIADHMFYVRRTK